jgi:glycine/D-amino acid oxidase-like deaminating enzyme
MKVAVVGAGFSGLASAWHLLNAGAEVTLFDPAGIGGGTSGIAAGLLHTYAGLHSKLNWKGTEGCQATLFLLDKASEALQQPVYQKSGLLRVAMNESMQDDYRLCADKFEDVEWWEAERCQKVVPGIHPLPGIFIKSAYTVFSELYLKGLYAACVDLGAQFSKQIIQDFHAIPDFDAILVTAGAQTSAISALRSLPLTQVKGQILEVEWPATMPPLTFPVNSQAYIVMNPHLKSCVIGATYERDFTSDRPDEKVAVREIIPKAAALLPALGSARVIGCKAGIRSSTPDHRPLLKQVSENCWVLAGMGSKGLLYHALFAQEASQQILKD